MLRELRQPRMDKIMSMGVWVMRWAATLFVSGAAAWLVHVAFHGAPFAGHMSGAIGVFTLWYLVGDGGVR